MKIKYPANDKKKIMYHYSVPKDVYEQDRVERIVAGIAKPSWNILDFGCGSGQVAVQRLKSQGLKRTYGHDFFLDNNVSYGKFDIVFLQNIINNVPTIVSLYMTLYEAAAFLKDNGLCIINYPQERMIKLGNKKMRSYIEEVFKSVFPLGSEYRKQVPVWSCRVAEIINDEQEEENG